MLATHRDAEERYTIIRKAVLDELNKDFFSSNQRNLKAKLIDASALTHSARWNYSSKRKVDWEWVEGYSAFKFRYPKRFEMALWHKDELALWHKDELASLSLGRPTYQGSKLRLDFIEGNPDKPGGVKVFEPTFLAMVGYAQALGASELRVMNPINGDVRRYYERFGFAYIAKSNYLYVKL